jgi:integrase
MEKPKQKRPRGTGSKVLRGRIWWVKYSYKGCPVWESTHSTVEAEADRLLRRRLGEIETGGKPFTRTKVTVEALVNLVVSDYRIRKLKDLEITEYRANKHVIRLVGKVKVERFGTYNVNEYIETRRKEGAQDTTINRELSIIRRGFRLGEQHDPPMVGKCPHIPKLEEDNVRQGFLEAEQYRALREALPEHLRCLLVVGYHLGLRLGTLRRMKWSQVDLEAGTIRIPKSQTKQKKSQTVPIYGEMRPWLDMQYADHRANWPSCEYVFHHHNSPVGHHVGGWNEACESAGIPRVLRHDLRRTAVRNMERAGIPRSVAMRITGHKTEATYLRYDIVDEKDLQRAGKKMEQFFEANGSNTVAVEQPQKIRKDVN